MQEIIFDILCGPALQSEIWRSSCFYKYFVYILFLNTNFRVHILMVPFAEAFSLTFVHLYMADCKLEYGRIIKSFFTIIYSILFQVTLELVQVTAFRSLAHSEE
jgi:hypothetical protein